ncbi:MAG: hypothetical protein K5745_03415 [Saccharofermentans sp.]|nr:hypothetical protein [Saccharofermentans sp.]
MSDKFEAPTFSEDELIELEDLYQAILTMESPEEMNRFFTDLCSINELHSFLHRWQIVRRIEQGKSYEEIIRELAPKEESSTEAVSSSGRKNGRVKGKTIGTTKVSSTTISRVKACYVNPDGGYRTALKRLAAKNKKKIEE